MKWFGGWLLRCLAFGFVWSMFGFTPIGFILAFAILSIPLSIIMFIQDRRKERNERDKSNQRRLP